jgi:2-keto-4-pentenoate hydratase/2-oxohepta-3-ene-1,7-dioic acid hydratase in catechol pathway
MKLVSYERQGKIRVAAARDGRYVDLNQADSSLPASMKELLALGPDGVRQAEAAVLHGEPFDPQSVRTLAPVPDPQKIICVGLNYADHAKETGATVGDEPVIFNKFPTALRADGEPIALPKASSQVDYEAELVVVIGRAAKHVSREESLSYVGGYAVGHDVSARDWQKGKPGKQWLLGKSFDSFAPCGPFLVTPDEVGDAGKLDIRLRLNGQVMQDSNTRQLIFPIDFLVAYLSSAVTLLPGDLIYTGTPPGVGMAREPRVFLQPGDTVEVEIEKLGVLRNPVIAEA